MGFMKPSSPKTIDEPPPTVADTADTDTQNAYDQKASRRRGLLSTILSRRENSAAGASGYNTPNPASQSTLG